MEVVALNHGKKGKGEGKGTGKTKGKGKGKSKENGKGANQYPSNDYGKAKAKPLNAVTIAVRAGKHLEIADYREPIERRATGRRMTNITSTRRPTTPTRSGVIHRPISATSTRLLARVPRQHRALSFHTLAASTHCA